MTPQQLYEAGRLSEAIAALDTQLKANPTDAGARSLLCQFLCLAGRWERADKQLEMLSRQTPESILGIALFQQLIHAEQWRHDVFAQGRVPEFLERPPEHIQGHLRAIIALREGNAAEAAALLRQAVALRPAVQGVCNSQPFRGLSDPNEVTASFFEVHTTNGKYYWVPFDYVEIIEFRPIKQPRDLLWRPARMAVTGGMDGEVYLPAIYCETYNDEDEDLRLARRTEWRGGGEAPVTGAGQRLFDVGTVETPMLEIQSIQFHPVTK
jgi:type VI secretion system protein ImpE